MDLSFFLLMGAFVLVLEQEACAESPSVTDPWTGRASPLPSVTDPWTDRVSLIPAVTNPQADRVPTGQQGLRALRRDKRCSCENLKDKECVYFCHIGIVWVNTPSHVVPYGMGSFPVRMKRGVKRCFCTKRSDTECVQFCSRRTLQHQ